MDNKDKGRQGTRRRTSSPCCPAYSLAPSANYSDHRRVGLRVGGGPPQRVPAQRYATCINRLPHDHGPIKTDTLSSPRTPSAALSSLHTRLRCCRSLMDAPILNWILFLGREVTTQVRRGTVLAGRIRSADQNRFAAPPFLGPTLFPWRMLDMERLGVQGRLGAREGVCSSCDRPIRPYLCRFTACAHFTFNLMGGMGLGRLTHKQGNYSLTCYPYS